MPCILCCTLHTPDCCTLYNLLYIMYFRQLCCVLCCTLSTANQCDNCRLYMLLCIALYYLYSLLYICASNCCILQAVLYVTLFQPLSFTLYHTIILQEFSSFFFLSSSFKVDSWGDNVPSPSKIWFIRLIFIFLIHSSSGCMYSMSCFVWLKVSYKASCTLGIFPQFVEISSHILCCPWTGNKRKSAQWDIQYMQ